MFLGISYNKWHGIIAFTGETLIAIVVVILTSFGWMFAFVVAFGIGLLLQSLYENFQLQFTNVVDIYGSYENFKKDSLDDFRYFFIGSGCSLALIILNIFVSTFGN